MPFFPFKARAKNTEESIAAYRDKDCPKMYENSHKSPNSDFLVVDGQGTSHECDYHSHNEHAWDEEEENPASDPVTGSGVEPTWDNSCQEADVDWAMENMPQEGDIALADAQKKKVVALQVGDKRFVTTIATLTWESQYFASFFLNQNDDDKNGISYGRVPSHTGEWLAPEFNQFMNFPVLQEDGSYFIDANPDIFKHVLDYMRSKVYPLFFSCAKGHDYPMYSALYSEAYRFRLPNLMYYFELEGYHQAVAIEYNHSYQTVSQQYYKERTMFKLTWPNSADHEMQINPQWVEQKTYLCPRRIELHYGHQERCGRACLKAKNDTCFGMNEYDSTNVLKLSMIEKKVIFNLERLRVNQDDILPLQPPSHTFW
ncbi:hypothetical protein FQN57_001282 [Myotisia sp. PD_48]|nr:hypothetical protein FQN57_001282 [Myotisia sp. PD_48]